MWRQKQGTAMGTPAAVVIACIYLGYLEKNIFKTLREEGIALPLFCKRYIDDIIAIFPTMQSKTRFYELYNSQTPTIRVAIKQGDSVDFLDITIHKGDNFNNTHILDTKLFQKPLNNYLYLPPHSFHTRHIFNSFITAEIHRYRLNCSNYNEFILATNNLFLRLLARGYKRQVLHKLFANPPTREALIEKAKERAKMKEGQKSLQQKEIKSSPLIFKTTWNTRYLQVKLRPCLEITEAARMDEDFFTVFGKRQPIICFKRSKNLKDLLTQARYKHEISPAKLCT
jgi:hypothetical protein